MQNQNQERDRHNHCRCHVLLLSVRRQHQTAGVIIRPLYLWLHQLSKRTGTAAIQPKKEFL